MADKDTTYEAEWTGNLAHRHDPNRVVLEPAQGLSRADRLPRQLSTERPPLHLTTGQQPMPMAIADGPQPMDDGEPSYYDISLLQAPVWKWEIASYFFLGGVSAGSYLIARAAERAGGDNFRQVRRLGAFMALATVIPCPPLLIADLGDPKRFHHMLRLFKPRSPMNVGSWSLVAYSGMTLATAVREALRPSQDPTQREKGQLSALVKSWLAIHDFIGIPFSLLIAGYTGVLLSSTANPLWRQNTWLGPLFSASAVSTGAEAVKLALECFPDDASPSANVRSHQVLKRVDTIGHAAEAVCMRGFMQAAGERARPLRSGKARIAHRVAIGALITGEVLKLLPLSERFKRPARILSAAAGLVAGFALRWSMVYGGKEAGDDAELARLDSRQR